jgi:phosphatidylglycerophosphatase A
MRGIARILATGFGLGRVPLMPGTVASVAALPVAVWIAFVGDWQAVLACAALISLVGIWACGVHAHTLGVTDPSECVLDEIAGQFLALAPLAPLGRVLNIGSIAAAFFLFRFFDIVKPWPISRLERLPGGLGIMADDIFAGLVSALLVVAAAYMNWI